MGVLWRCMRWRFDGEKSDGVLTNSLREDNRMRTPILHTERLDLRPFTAEDAQDVFECWESDPDVAKYMFWCSHNDIEKTKNWVRKE